LAIPRQFSTVDVLRAPEATLLACLREDYDSITALRMMPSRKKAGATLPWP